MTILEFKPRDVVKEIEAIKLSAMDVIPDNVMLEYWKERNDIISKTFPTLSVWEKQDTLDTVLLINNELYELALKLKKGE
jgi:hypothetical protein